MGGGRLPSSSRFLFVFGGGQTLSVLVAGRPSNSGSIPGSKNSINATGSDLIVGSGVKKGGIGRHGANPRHPSGIYFQSGRAITKKKLVLKGNNVGHSNQGVDTAIHSK